MHPGFGCGVGKHSWETPPTILLEGTFSSSFPRRNGIYSTTRQLFSRKGTFKMATHGNVKLHDDQTVLPPPPPHSPLEQSQGAKLHSYICPFSH